MAKRQNNTPDNVVRIDGEGKVHENGGGIVPLCKFRGHGDHTWVTTDDAVDCGLCISRGAKRREARERLEYATRAAETQDAVMSQGARDDLDTMAKGEPKNGTPVPRAEFTAEGVKPLPAVTPVQDDNGENITVPVDYDNPSAGRRELDASKGERVIGESTFKRRKIDALAEMEAMIARVRARVTAKMSDDMVEDIMRQERTGTFAPVFFEPTNPECPGNVIPPLPEHVHPHTWEMAHDANTEAARDYWMRKVEDEKLNPCNHCGESLRYSLCDCLSL